MAAFSSRSLVPLLAVAVFINYIDRGNLATASPVLKDELGLENAEIGLLLSSFYWTYTLAQPVAGWLAQRFDTRSVIAVGVLVWSLATLLSGLVTGFALLLPCRLLLGLGESVMFPCALKLIGDHEPETGRGRANGWIAVAQYLGPACGTLLGGLIVAEFGWRPLFVLAGLISLTWLVPWYAAGGWAFSRVEASRWDPPGFAEILGQRALWGSALGQFSSNYCTYFVMSWLPLYLVKAQHFQVADMAVLGAIVYGLCAVSAVLNGRLSDWLIDRGHAIGRVRKSFAMAGALGICASLALCASAEPVTAVVLLCLTALFLGTQNPMIFSMIQTLSGARARGRWTGLQNFLGNWAGILSPWVTGIVVDRTGQFFWAFVITAMVALLGVVGWGMVMPRVTPVRWRADAAAIRPAVIGP